MPLAPPLQLLLIPLLLGVGRPAVAGELHVTAPASLVVFVDDTPATQDGDTGVVVLGNLEGGSYQVELRTAMDRLKAQQLVEVGADEVVELVYDKKQLVVRARRPVAPDRDAAVTPNRPLEGAVQATGAAAAAVQERVEQLEQATDGAD